MKTISTLFLSLAFMISGHSQSEKKASPAKTSRAEVGETEVVVNYSSPSKKGREIFGGLVAYDKVWRTGANEATTISFSETTMVNGTEVEAGTYALFTIPGKKEWTIILNSHSEQWGAYNYDSDKDVMRFTVEAEQVKAVVESFTITVSEKGLVEMSWDTTKVGFKVGS